MTPRAHAHEWWTCLKSAIWTLFSGEMSLVAAGCAFYATLALFPAITTLISLYGLAFNPITVEPQLLYLKHLMPPAAFQLIAGRIQHLVSGGKTSLGIGLAISLLFTLYSTASGTKSLIYALNMIHKREETRGIIRFQLVTLGMTLVAIIGAVIAISVLVGLPLLFTFFGLGKDAAALAIVIGFALMVGFMGIALGLLYRYGPSFRRDLGHTVIPGVVVAILLWLIVSYGFAVYVGQFAAYSRTYGPLATIIGLMMWFYLTAYTLLLGALFNAALDRAIVARTP
ncbi:MAG: YihY/virulence factor BrkB family protein [Acidiphilium sp.]|nr:YihY/virulence factor BrkB family protein [Acidiphilium sp.]MDD4936064.1 YihY/virulence factor BrkB family protein [Acidiphilium sp.]